MKIHPVAAWYSTGSSLDVPKSQTYKLCSPQFSIPTGRLVASDDPSARSEHLSRPSSASLFTEPRDSFEELLGRALVLVGNRVEFGACIAVPVVGDNEYSLDWINELTGLRRAALEEAAFPREARSSRRNRSMLHRNVD